MKKENIKNAPFTAITCIFVLIIGIVGLIIIINQKSNAIQSSPAVCVQIVFDGEYKIADGEWTEYRQGMHIPSNKGDITLRGKFASLNNEIPDLTDFNLVFYTNHISGGIYRNGQMVHMFDCENEYIGNIACGAMWSGNYKYSVSEGDVLEIILHNPHVIGNGSAVDDFLNNIYVGNISVLSQQLKDKADIQMTIALSIFVLSAVTFGIALFASILNIPRAYLLWLVATASVCAGGWFFFGAQNLHMDNSSVILNTTGFEICKMLYGFFASCLAVECLKDRMKRTGIVLSVILGAAVSVCIFLPAFGGMKIYDMNPYWIAVQCAVGSVLMIMNIVSILTQKHPQRFLSIPCVVAAVIMLFDMTAAVMSWHQDIYFSQIFFIIFFVCVLAAALKIIPESLRSALRAKTLEKELENSRIEIMLSQIKPHFIYNTLTTISQLCLEQPETASALTDDFSHYLRGNFSELNRSAPIPISQEIEHVKHYVNVEHIRFPDMQIEFDLQCEDFLVPALSVQPLVENAIKHGLMKLEKGGSVNISTFETPDSYCVKVSDTGAGFDTSVLDNSRRIGINNIRNRLAAMSGGTLEIESVTGSGTTAIIKIPKGEKQ